MGNRRRTTRNTWHAITRSWSSWVVGAALLGTITYAVAEEVRLTTYYPSPRGNYMQLLVQDHLGVGTNAPHPFAVADFRSPAGQLRGVVIPTMTTAERDQMQLDATTAGTPLPRGMMIYNRQTNQLEFYDENGWPPPVGMWNRTKPDATTDIVFANRTGKVGIGFDIANPLDRPAEQLHITGNFRLPATTVVLGVPTGGVIYAGVVPLLHTYGDQNVFLGELAGNFTTALGVGGNTAVGASALAAITSGSHNVAVGIGALSANTGASGNTAIGSFALQNNDTGWANVAVGDSALISNSNGESNTAVGYKALVNNTTADGNTAVGTQALQGNSIGASNTAVGAGALQGNADGSNNTAVGVVALSSNITGDSNVAIGPSALLNNVGGGDNVAVGSLALSGNLAGARNTALGAQALQSNTDDENTAVGYAALRDNTGGGWNTAVGFEALRSNTSGGSNSAFGNWALHNNIDGTKNVAVGAGALGGNTSGGANTAVGLAALASNTIGGANTVVGEYASSNNPTGNSNTIIGMNAMGGTAIGDSNTIIGAFAGHDVNGSGNVIIGYQVGMSGLAGGSNMLAIDNHDDPFGPFIYGNFSSDILQIFGRVGIGGGIPLPYQLYVTGSAYSTGGWLGPPSDARLKTNIQPLESGALKQLLALRGVQFEWKDPARFGNRTGPQMGFIAQEVESVFPEWIRTDGEGHKVIDTSGFNALAVEAIRELKSENVELRKRLEALEARDKKR